MTLNVDVHSSE